MQIINNPSENRGEFYSSQTENYSPGNSFSVALGITPEKHGFQQFYILSEQRTSNMTGVHSFKLKKKRERLAHPVSQYGLGARKRALSSKEYSHWCPRKGGIYLCLQNRHSLLLDSTPFSLMVRAAVQYTCDGPQTECPNWHKVQAESCIS